LRKALRFLLFFAAIAAVLTLVVGGSWYVLRGWRGLRQTSSPEAQTVSFKKWLLGLYLRLHQDDITTPASTDPTPLTFIVEPGETAAVIAEHLEEMGLIKDATLFRLLASYHGVGDKLEAGEYVLRRNMSMEEILAVLQRARLKEVTVTIPEGWRVEQIAEMLTAEGILDGQAFLKQTREREWAERFAFLRDRPEDAPPGLEGFLFPDTYRLPAQAEPADLIERMLANFDRRFDARMRARAREVGMSIYEVVTLASIVEREAVIPEERPLIASVYLNRLEKGMYLQADPTVQYAKGRDPVTGKWWPHMTIEEMSTVDSPYNTFLNPGLPPGPICNPGLGSIRAVLWPADTDYLFFFSKGDGSHAFASTYEEHLKNQERYR